MTLAVAEALNPSKPINQKVKVTSRLSIVSILNTKFELLTLDVNLMNCPHQGGGGKSVKCEVSLAVRRLRGWVPR